MWRNRRRVQERRAEKRRATRDEETMKGWKDDGRALAKACAGPKAEHKIAYWAPHPSPLGVLPAWRFPDWDKAPASATLMFKQKCRCCTRKNLPSTLIGNLFWQSL